MSRWAIQFGSVIGSGSAVGGAQLPLKDGHLVAQEGEDLHILSRSLIGSSRSAVKAWVMAK
ncbi:hypothetical protein [Streptomyces sp. NPDC050485]|uniref:hypothetical protein n=1 Tax=Streptomyces sp. NPDC050485 TaxID=3365617 RepID=UPI0037A08932